MSTTKVSSSKKNPGTRGGHPGAGTRAALALTALLALSSALSTMELTASAASVATSVPPGAPPEDARYAAEGPAPNADLYNRRVARSTISSKNVSKLGIAWTIPLSGAGVAGRDVDRFSQSDRAGPVTRHVDHHGVGRSNRG